MPVVKDLHSARICRALRALAALLCLASAACALPGRRGGPELPEAPATISLTSPAFAEGTAIPRRFTCDGEDLSPPLTWSEPPEGTRAFALVVDDPDAPGGTFTHWLVYDLPADARSLPEGVPAESELPGGGRQGENDFGRTGYGGPCPPRGEQHRYRFAVYALDAPLGLPPGAGRGEVLEAIAGHALARGMLTGTYRRGE
jgi:Raf kinase inhibitor-like YbhB/YbcL family protein